MTSPKIDMTSSHNTTSGGRLSENMSGVRLGEQELQMMADLERLFKDSKYTYRDPWTATLIGVYVAVFLLSIVGNVLVVVIIKLDKSNRGIDAYLMLNLAIADLLGTSTIAHTDDLIIIYCATRVSPINRRILQYYQGRTRHPEFIQQLGKWRKRNHAMGLLRREIFRLAAPASPKITGSSYVRAHGMRNTRGGFNGRPLVQWPTRPLGGWALEARKT